MGLNRDHGLADNLYRNIHNLHDVVNLPDSDFDRDFHKDFDNGDFNKYDLDDLNVDLHDPDFHSDNIDFSHDNESPMCLFRNVL